MNRGFSLIEIAVVLVILGLITGGILAGQSLIKASTLRSITTDIQKYQTAINNFREQYAALPGDFANAQKYWGVGASCPSDTTGGTCNGNNDGLIFCSPDYTGCEMTYSAQHLALAGLIAGNYNPQWPAARPIAHGPYAFPLRLDKMSLMTAYSAVYPAVYYDNFGGKNYLRASVISTAPYFSGYSDPGMRCQDAWSIDAKMDDAKPGTGSIVTPRLWCVTDTAAASYSTAAYLLETSTQLTWLEIALN